MTPDHRLSLPPTSRLPIRGPAAAAALLAALAACSPTVRVEAPKDPIRIDLNVRIEQEVRIKVDRELEEAFTENEDIF